MHRSFLAFVAVAEELFGNEVVLSLQQCRQVINCLAELQRALCPYNGVLSFVKVSDRHGVAITLFYVSRLI